MKVGSIGYIPPNTIGHADAFLRNLDKYPPRLPLVLYTARDDLPGAIRLNASPDALKDSVLPNGQRNKWAVNNICFFTGLRVALAQGFTHIIYLEEDCRVARAGWDEVIFDEFFAGFPWVAAGTLVTHNPCTYSPLAARRWYRLVSGNPRKNYPVATYGWVGADGPQTKPCVFPNGALGVYDLRWMARVFDLSQTVTLAQQAQAWDYQLGWNLWDMWQEDVYEVLGFLRSVYSGYGNVVTTEEERQQMLLSGAVVAAHQFKSDWTP